MPPKPKPKPKRPPPKPAAAPKAAPTSTAAARPDPAPDLPSSPTAMVQWAIDRATSHRPTGKVHTAMRVSCLGLAASWKAFFADLPPSFPPGVSMVPYEYTIPSFRTTRNVGWRIRFPGDVPAIDVPGLPAYVTGIPITTSSAMCRLLEECSEGAPRITRPVLSSAQLAALGQAPSDDDRATFPRPPFPRARKILCVMHVAVTSVEALYLSADEDNIWEALAGMAALMELRRLLRPRDEGAGPSSAASSWSDVSTDEDLADDGDPVGGCADDEEEDGAVEGVMEADLALCDLTPAAAGGSEVKRLGFTSERDAILKEITRQDGTVSAAAARPEEGTGERGDVLHPQYAANLAALSALYADPIRVDSDAFKKVLADLDPPVSYSAFTDMRKGIVGEKSMAAIPHAPYAPRGADWPPRRSWTLSRIDFVMSVEAAIVVLIAEGELTLEDVGEYKKKYGCAPVLVLLYIQDSAGRRINLLQVTHGVVIPAAVQHIGRLAVVHTLWQHFGPWADIHRRSVMAGHVGEQLERLQGSQILGHRVRVLNCSDMGELPKMYMTPDLYGPVSLPWIMSAKHGYGFVTRNACPRCMQSKLAMCTLPSQQELPYRVTPPSIRGRPSLTLEPYYLVLHEMANSVNALAHDIVTWCMSRSKAEDDVYAKMADKICGLWSRSGGFNPRMEDEEGENDEDEETRHAGGRMFAEDKQAKSKKKSTGAAAGAAAGAAKGAAACRKSLPTKAKAAEAVATDPPEQDDEPAEPELVKGKHTVRPKAMKEHLDDEPTWTEIGDEMDCKDFEIVRVEKFGGDGSTVTIGVIWKAAHLYVRILWRAKIQITGPDSVRSAAGCGRGIAEDWKFMLADALPWSAEDVQWDDIDWVRKALAGGHLRSVDELKESLKNLHFDARRAAWGVTPHLVFEHGCDVMQDPDIPLDVAVRLTEEAADHFFVYLYYLVPAIFPRSLTTLANASCVWSVTVEVQAIGCPTTTNATFATKVTTNKAYA